MSAEVRKAVAHERRVHDGGYTNSLHFRAYII